MTELELDDRLDVTERPRLSSLLLRRNVLLITIGAYLIFRIYEVFLFYLHFYNIQALFQLNILYSDYTKITPGQMAYSGSSLLFWLSILFLAIWFYSVFQNLKKARLNTNTSDTMAAVGFFIPIINFVQPYYVMSEAFNASRFLAGDIKEKWKKHPTPFLIYLWWFILLLTFIIVPLFSSFFTNYFLYVLVKTILTLVTCLLLFVFVIKISNIHQKLVDGQRSYPTPKRK